MPLVDERGFHEAAFGAHWYPRKRKRQNSGAATEQLSGGQLPRTRVFPWVMSVTGTSRRSLSTQRLVGPAIIKDISLTPGFGLDPPNCTIEVGIAHVSVTEAGVALGSARPFSVQLELQNPFGVIGDAAGDGIPLGSAGTALRWPTIPLDIVVTDPEFFVVVSVVNNSASAATMVGQVRVVEAVNPEALRFFL